MTSDSTADADTVSTAAPPSVHAERLQTLDIVRGLAALAVVLFHYTMIMPQFVPGVARVPLTNPYGLYGVHLFFIVSGFVILMSLERSTARHFLVSRFTRLYPAYWLACIMTFTIMTLGAFYPYPVTMTDFLVNLTMMQGFVKVGAVDGAYWSLTYELGFYAFLFGVFRLGVKRFVPLLPLYMIAGSVAFYFFAHVIPHPLHLLLMANAYSHLFGCGLALYLLRARGHSWLQWTAVAITPLVQALHDQWVGLFAGIVIVAVMVVASLWRTPIGRWARPLIWLGSISYALYLVHQMLGYAAIAWLQAHGWGAWPSMLVTLAGVLIVAHAITHYWERPLAKWMKARLSKRPAVSAAPIVSVGASS